MGINEIDIVALLTAIGSLAMAWNSRQKAKSEAKSAATVAYLDIIGPLRQELADLRKRVDSLEAENRELWRGVRILSKQLEESGITPAWHPPEDGGA